MAPKKSEATGATYAGHEGIVQDAHDRLWQLDPEKDINGELLPGDHPDRENEKSDPPSEDDNYVPAPDDEPRPIEKNDGADETSGQGKDETNDAGEGKRAPAGDANTSAPRSGSKAGAATKPGNSSKVTGS